MVCKALGDLLRVTLICFDLLVWRDRHRARRKNDTVDLVRRKLMVKTVAQTTSLVAAAKLTVAAVLTFNTIEIFQNLFVVRLHLDNGK